MARLFTAVELGERSRDALGSAQARLASTLRAAGDRNLRLVRAHQLHLTLVFLGEVEEGRVGSVIDLMSQDLPFIPFDVDFTGWGVFPPRGAPRVLWCGVTRGVGELLALHAAVATRLEVASVAPEQRAYRPHLTVGRWRDHGSPRVRELLPPPTTLATERVEAVTLFSSRLLPGGPEHTPLARARLAGPGAPLH